VASWLAASLPVHPEAGGETAVQRALTGDVLVALGDPRFNAQCHYLPVDENFGFVRIAPDPKFKIGTRKADFWRIAEFIGSAARDNELNDKPTPTLEFFIARYTVTVAQFRAFVEAANFKLGDEGALRDPDSRPVRFVSWNEALQYCDWLQNEFISQDALKRSAVAQRVSQGWRITLPSELEWEKAARGGLTGKVFAWGDDPDANRANYDDTGIDDATAVGCFPENNYGLHDMVGNVWEWTRSVYEPYPYKADDGRERLTIDDGKVVRGGSWYYHRGYARCAFRGRNVPDLRSSYVGFRVVLRSPPVEKLRSPPLCTLKL
jgi:formylglycine-generating enzyme required for sulfatase activity